ncbi:hypothetical protein [Roseimaritima ulvae]|uniref:Uncharacterized protein n=1 Tax=Roseimaritima ulvae TaxID=980254 RepID=A0A5B9QMJ5_9BACT|nr:hypothetical protein [Roseimaritima ulvae]QEG39299.1 hypothetical protein UC8_12630 [Roseimaritima ulvae]
MKFNSIPLMIVAASCLIASLGCKPSSPPTEEAPPQFSAADDHGHDHPHDDSTDHSMAGHGHGAGPHDGTVGDWGGGKYHVEFTVDHDQQQATVYVLGSDEKTATPIDAESIELSIVDPPMQVTLAAQPQEGDPEGESSRFVGTHEKLGVVKEYAGTMTGVVDGTPYTADFAEQAHDDHAAEH